ncbi:MAG: hypothetical protein HOE62_06430 [Alphaproteobacteria bacterium]|jgi:hypothetical protein|nr:hypothetical protein [Alphaproteobacteria bacterium]MBT4017567.1 hypothetical protein [Alphaproteobacteria bacterium]MBT4966108.1 hypothetical protein [Alphaproteobacteria bacterium]MBT5159432.1 hypothetical protein [Alphaproteobacteria bacterium]MBT5917925.1 hypothetical protein [Alphaproteobacteria bacterium]
MTGVIRNRVARIGISLFAGALAMAYSTDKALAADTFVDALTGGKPVADLRLRYESVDQAGLSNDADALTLRTRVGYGTADWQGLSAAFAVENISALGSEDYNDTINGKSTFPTIADPETTEVDTAWIRYTGLANTSLTYGRQKVILDNARFVGNVGFRQNQQTFDGLVASNSSLPKTTLIYGYVYNVNRIFGDDASLGDLSTRTHLVNISNQSFKPVKITGYGYFLDVHRVASLSTRTLGLRLTGKQNLPGDEFKLLYAVEYARQSDYADNTANIGLDYKLLEPGIAWKSLVVKAGYEILEGDGTTGFSTPLATLHAFQGFTDKFLSTPANGIEDKYLKAVLTIPLDGPLKGSKIAAQYHDLKAENGGSNYGSEWNFALSKGFKTDFGKMGLALKYADYDADTFATDTQKIWLSVSYKY